MVSSPLARLNTQNLWLRWILVLASVGIYAIAFLIFYPTIGAAMGALSVLPVSFIAWFYGLRGGVLAAILTIPLNTLLLTLVGQPGWTSVFREGGIPGEFAVLIMGMVVGEMRDISYRLQKELLKRHQVEEALRESEEWALQLADSAFEAITIHSKGIILEVNQAYCRMYGYERSEVLGMSALELTARESRDMVKLKIMTGDTEPYEAIALAKNGRAFPVELMGRPITYRGHVMRVTVIHDITERKQAEAQRLELAVAHERTQILRDFLNTISHDFKTPLTVISTTVYLLEKLSDPEMQKDKLRVLKAETAHLEKLIKDILVMSQLEALPKLEFRPVVINELMENTELRFRSMAEGKEITFITDLTSTLPSILADEENLDQALVNLVENALNYTPKGGTITLRTTLRDNRIIAEISDTGIGISEIDLSHIFDHFFRADKARTTYAHGTGLGLAIVKKIIDIHNGTIEVESSIGVGSTFRICLPVIQTTLQSNEDNSQHI